MKLLICMITHQRLAYTKRTLRYLWSSLSDDADYHLIVVDNASTDETPEYLKALKQRGRIDDLILNPENYYPGKACNIGWKKGLETYNATHLMRLDNDMVLVKGWDRKVADYFDAIPELGQLGLEHEAIETHEAELYKRSINGFVINEWPGVVGGPMVMPRKLWDRGVCYDESPWEHQERGVPAIQEDSRLSQLIKSYGYAVGHAQEELGRTFATRDSWKDFPEYYKKTMSERGYHHLLDEAGL